MPQGRQGQSPQIKDLSDLSKQLGVMGGAKARQCSVITSKLAVTSKKSISIIFRAYLTASSVPSDVNDAGFANVNEQSNS